MLSIATDYITARSTSHQTCGSFESRMYLFGKHQLSLATGPFSAAHQFHHPQRNYSTCLDCQHNHRIDHLPHFASPPTKAKQGKRSTSTAQKNVRSTSPNIARGIYGTLYGPHAPFVVTRKRLKIMRHKSQDGRLKVEEGLSSIEPNGCCGGDLLTADAESIYALVGHRLSPLSVFLASLSPERPHLGLVSHRED